MQGKIIKGIAGFYYIHVETSGIYECKAKGIFRNRHIKPLVGDNVEIEVIDKDNFKGNVVDILPRKNELIRPASANIDQAMVIFAVKTPEPNFNLLDKFILMMNYQDVPTVVCFNKEELADDEYKNECAKDLKNYIDSLHVDEDKYTATSYKAYSTARTKALEVYNTQMFLYYCI